MAITTYTRTPGKTIDSGQLTKTMNIDGAITPNCDYITMKSDGDMDLVFASALSAGEETQMDANITAHTASDYAGTTPFNVADADNTVKVNQLMTAYTSLTAPRTVTCPDARRMVIDENYEVKDQALTAGTHNISVTAFAGQTIEGVSSVDITVDGGSIIFYSNGSDLFQR